MGFAIERDDGVFLTLDATTAQVFVSASIVTEHPVEEGVAVTDHVQPQARRVSVSGVVTETPYTLQDSDYKMILFLSDGADRTEAARDFMRSIEGALVTVISDRVGTIENCAVERWVDSVDRYKRLNLDIDLREIRIAESETVFIPPDAPANEGMSSEQDTGEQATQSASATAAAADQSVLSGLLSALF